MFNLSANFRSHFYAKDMMFFGESFQIELDLPPQVIHTSLQNVTRNRREPVCVQNEHLLFLHMAKMFGINLNVPALT